LFQFLIAEVDELLFAVLKEPLSLLSADLAEVGCWMIRFAKGIRGNRHTQMGKDEVFAVVSLIGLTKLKPSTYAASVVLQAFSALLSFSFITSTANIL
jgi:hypothetical protein